MSGEQGAFVWCELMTTDVAAAKAFYAGVVGWNILDVPMPGMTYSLLHVGDTDIAGLMPLPKEAHASGMRPAWVGYIGVGDTDAAAAKVQHLGGHLLGPPIDIPTVGRFVTVTYPQGALFTLFKPAMGGQRIVSSEPGNVGWHELHTNDWPRAFEFYADMFGWAKGDALDMGPMGTYQVFKIGGLAEGGMFKVRVRRRRDSGCIISTSAISMSQPSASLTAAVRSRRVRIKCRAATGFCRRLTRRVRCSLCRA